MLAGCVGGRWALGSPWRWDLPSCASAAVLVVAAAGLVCRRPTIGQRGVQLDLCKQSRPPSAKRNRLCPPRANPLPLTVWRRRPLQDSQEGAASLPYPSTSLYTLPVLRQFVHTHTYSIRMRTPTVSLSPPLCKFLIRTCCTIWRAQNTLG